MDGDSLPSAAFISSKRQWDGVFLWGLMSLSGDASKCVGCNQCAFVCSRAAIRRFQLTADEAGCCSPHENQSRDNRPANEYKFVMAVSPLDCMGCGRVRHRLPHQGNHHGSAGVSGRSAGGLRLLRRQHLKKPSKFADDTVIGSQFNQPLLEFSGSCAGCAERLFLCSPDRSAVRREDVHLQRYRLLLYLGRYRFHLRTPSTKDSGHGHCMVQLLFEDNAEHGLGLYLGRKTIRENLIKRIAEGVAGSDKASR